MEPHSDAPPINTVGRIFVAACALVALALAGIVMNLALVKVVLNQSEQNQRHVDCIVAAFNPTAPEYCQPVIEDLRSKGILRPTTIASVP